LSTNINATVDALGNRPASCCRLDKPAISTVRTSCSRRSSQHRDRRQLLRCRRACHLTARKGRLDRRHPAQGQSQHQRDYDKELYKARHLIGNFFAKLKQFRAIATRYDKRAINFLAGIYLASIIIWLN
jgi:transposase